MKIIIDGDGGDKAPDAIIQGAIEAAPDIPGEIILLLQEAKAREALQKISPQADKIRILPVTEEITNEDSPVKAVRTKKDSAIVRGLHMLKEGEGDILISAGNTGALLAGGLLLLGRSRGIDRPALATVYPVVGGRPSLLTDAGANAECRPANLLQFAQMGKIYMEQVLGRKDPTVGLLNNGAERGKGTTLTKEAYELLAASDCHFIGNVEARDVPDGRSDIIVTDGFTGNVLLKTTEGMGLMFIREMKKMFLEDGRSRLAALLLKKKLKDAFHTFDYAEYGGAPILGLKGALLKMHGSSDSRAVRMTILKAVPYVEGRVTEIIAEACQGGLDEPKSL